MAIDTVTANGVRVNYDPPSGIDNVTEVRFDPTAQTYATAVSVACPQGSSGGILTLPPGDLTDTIHDCRYPSYLGTGSPQLPQCSFTRQADAGISHTVKSTSGNKVFSTNAVARGTSGSSEPSAAGNADDGQVHWGAAVTYIGAWQANKTVTTSHYIVETNSADGVAYVWKCASGGVTDGSRPSGFDFLTVSTTFVGENGDVTWTLRGVFKGAWTGSTVYGVDARSDRLTVRRHYVGHSTNPGTVNFANQGVLLPWSYATTGTFATTSSEPAWSAAANGTYWLDGQILFIQGKNLYGGTADATDEEMLVVTGLKAPAGAATVRVTNIGTNRQLVVLADHAGLTDPSHQSSQVATDCDSTVGNRFDFGGRNNDVYLEAGEYVDLLYSSTKWVQSGAGGGGGSSSLDPAASSEASVYSYHGH